MKKGDRVKVTTFAEKAFAGTVVYVHRESAHVQVKSDSGQISQRYDGDCEPATLVLFRVFKKDGEVIAIFPNDRIGQGTNVNSFQHIGQHGLCPRGVMNDTRPATEAEYRGLKKELESEPYNYVLKVGKRWPK